MAPMNFHEYKIRTNLLAHHKIKIVGAVCRIGRRSIMGKKLKKIVVRAVTNVYVGVDGCGCTITSIKGKIKWFFQTFPFTLQPQHHDVISFDFFFKKR